MGNLTRVTRYGVVNCYLVQDDDGLTLIDTMIPRSSKAILAAAERLGAPIVRIVLTHAHGDHIGSHARHGQAHDARLLVKDTSLDADEPQTKIKGSVPGAATKPTRTIAPGERVGALEVLDAKGHTPGQLALLDTREGTLFCGDAYSTLGGVATAARANPRFPVMAIATWHRPTALASAKALRALSPERLAPGHGKIVQAPGAAMDAAIARVKL
jgi:glyoxylase-like metal-dependent hydrolase (beta-lactamase superfamily II)